MPETSPSRLIVPRHPLLQSDVASLREKTTPSHVFRAAMERVASHLVLAATADWPTTPQPVETPLTTTSCDGLDPNLSVWLVPILRAGLAFSSTGLAWLPQARVFHLGIARNEETLLPEVYYNNLPDRLPADPMRVLVLDPMLATGGSARWALEVLTDLGVAPEAISLLSCLAAPEGIAAVQQAYPAVTLVIASIDERLNEHGYIVPGLGDAGDRFFGT